MPEGVDYYLAGQRHRLLQFHFHTPSEHTLDGAAGRGRGRVGPAAAARMRYHVLAAACSVLPSAKAASSLAWCNARTALPGQPACWLTQLPPAGPRPAAGAGRHLAMEAHLVHKNLETGNLAVLGVFIEASWGAAWGACWCSFVARVRLLHPTEPGCWAAPPQRMPCTTAGWHQHQTALGRRLCPRPHPLRRRATAGCPTP